MRLRKRAAGLALGAGILFLLGTNVQAGWLFVLCALLLGTLVSGLILPGRMLRGIEVERRAPAEVVQGEDAFVDLVVTNRARGARLGLTLDDPHVAPTTLYLTKVSPGERVELVTVRPARKRGVQEASVVTLRSAAPVGVAERRRRLPVAGGTIVLPAVLPLGPLPFLAAASDPSRSSRSIPHKGSGPEYLGIREYRPGDSPRHVHWPSTARTGTVMVRELEEERSRRLAIVVDTLADVGEESTPLDACCTAAASIARVAIAEGHTMRMIAARAGRSVDVFDDVDEGSLRRRLAAIVPDGVPLAESLDRGAEALWDVDVVVLIFPTWRTNGDGGLAHAIEALAAARPSVVAVPVEVGPQDARRIAAMTTEEVDAFVASLVRSGADVYPWRHGASLGAALARHPVVTR
ncbi:MAG: DUF58 domain-containing protein [Actinomycetota bacterium]